MKKLIITLSLLIFLNSACVRQPAPEKIKINDSETAVEQKNYEPSLVICEKDDASCLEKAAKKAELKSGNSKPQNPRQKSINVIDNSKI